jgi:phosphatidylglycerol---prolipoprotein diacylglyceryl transferase
MIPYIEVKVLLDFGSVQVYTFGTLVGLAIVLGLYILTHRARQLSLDPEIAEHLHYWSISLSLFFGHVFTILFYEPGRLEREGPLLLLKVWDGMSSMGGITSGLIVGLLFLKIKKVKLAPYLDSFFYALTFAWTIARLGCTLVHDHPGALSDFFMAVQYPCDPSDPGGAICARHDLGLYEFLSFGFLSIYFYATRFKPRFAGFYILSWGLVMGPLRFMADFLRIDPTAGLGGDQRYGALTPAQITIIPLFILSVVVFVRWRKTGEVLTPIRVPFQMSKPEPPPKSKSSGKGQPKKKPKKRKR